MSEIKKAFLFERDQQIYAARATGASVTEIAKKFDMTVQGINTAIRRHIEQLNRTAVLAYPEVLAMELDRLDKLQRAIWPLTQHRVVTMDDGTQIKVEPDLKAIDQVTRIMQMRSKLMGLDVTQIDLRTTAAQANAGDIIKHALKGAEREEELVESSEDEAKALIELSVKSGILDEETGRALLEAGQVIEAEIVEDDDE